MQLTYVPNADPHTDDWEVSRAFLVEDTSIDFPTTGVPVGALGLLDFLQVDTVTGENERIWLFIDDGVWIGGKERWKDDMVKKP